MKELRPRVASLQSEISTREERVSRNHTSIKRIDKLLHSQIMMLEYKPVGDNEVAVGSVEAPSRVDAVAEEMERLKQDKDLKLMENQDLMAQLREARIALARVEINEWRAIGSKTYFGRLLRVLERILARLRADTKCTVITERASG